MFTYLRIFILLISGVIFGIEEKILICGVVKNAEHGFKAAKVSIEKLGLYFNDYRVIVYENNSVDNTKSLYFDWADKNSKVIFLSEDLSLEFLNNLTLKVGDFRTEHIARARNIVLKEAFKKEYDDYTYVMMVDLDDFDEWDICSIIDSIENPEREWDAIFANGSYDLYALRSKEFRICPELIGWHHWCDMQPLIGFRLKNILHNKKWYPVDSAFGGMGIYKRNSIKDCYYSGKIDNFYINKLSHLNYDGDLVFKKNKSRIKNLSRIFSEYSNWESLSFSQEAIPKIIHICEHVYFHYKMIEKGHDKLFINPKIIHRSKCNPNY